MHSADLVGSAVKMPNAANAEIVPYAVNVRNRDSAASMQNVDRIQNAVSMHSADLVGSAVKMPNAANVDLVVNVVLTVQTEDLVETTDLAENV
jgi:hypothetical protein